MSHLMLVNPKKPRRKKVARARAPKRSRASRVVTVAKKTISRYRRNPSPRASNIVETVKNGAIGAGGAIAAEILLSKLPVPAEFKSGNMSIVASALASVGVGMLVAKVTKKPHIGKLMAQGGVTVAMHGAMRSMVSGPMGLSGYYEFEPSTMGYYENQDLGYIEPTPVFEGTGIYN